MAFHKTTFMENVFENLKIMPWWLYFFIRFRVSYNDHEELNTILKNNNWTSKGWDFDAEIFDCQNGYVSTYFRIKNSAVKEKK